MVDDDDRDASRTQASLGCFLCEVSEVEGDRVGTLNGPIGSSLVFAYSRPFSRCLHSLLLIGRCRCGDDDGLNWCGCRDEILMEPTLSTETVCFEPRMCETMPESLCLLWACIPLDPRRCGQQWGALRKQRVGCLGLRKNYSGMRTIHPRWVSTI